VHVCSGDGSQLSSGTTGRKTLGVNNLKVRRGVVGNDIRDDVDCDSQCDGSVEFPIRELGLNERQAHFRD